MGWVPLLFAWIILASLGPDGLRDPAIAGAFIVGGFAVKNFLDTFWSKGANQREPRQELPNERRDSRRRTSSRGIPPSPNWSLARPDASLGTRASDRMLGRR